MSKLQSSQLKGSRVERQDLSIESEISNLKKKLEKFPDRQFSDEKKAAILNPEKRHEVVPEHDHTLQQSLEDAAAMLSDVENILNSKRTSRRDALASSLQNSFTQPHDEMMIFGQE